MNSRIVEIFHDKNLVEKIKNKLPYMFQLAELESSRAGKVGMEVGSLRERIIISLLIYKFGEENVDTELPITESEVDVKLFNEPISIKTVTGKKLTGIKLIWTVDRKKVLDFFNSYYPTCDVLLIQINWNNKGGFYFIPLEAQIEVFENIGRKNYIKTPKVGTNPRGVEFSSKAIDKLINHSKTLVIPIQWNKQEIKFNAYRRWLELWKEEVEDNE